MGVDLEYWTTVSMSNRSAAESHRECPARTSYAHVWLSFE